MGDSMFHGTIMALTWVNNIGKTITEGLAVIILAAALLGGVALYMKRNYWMMGLTIVVGMGLWYLCKNPSIVETIAQALGGEIFN